MIRVLVPGQLRALARVHGEMMLEVPPPVTLGAVLDAIERRYPMLCGAIRDRVSARRRPLLRLFADGQDLSFADADQRLPEAVCEGRAPLLVVGAIAGG
ncbi:MAG: MoaD/ThiS family protein [Pseudomonadota bacterium]|nr:MoaD/ThiS family protein [Pseudomonadota bacterium]